MITPSFLNQISYAWVMRKLLLGHLILSFLLCAVMTAFIGVTGPFGPDELNLQDTALMAGPYALCALAFLLGILGIRRGQKSAPWLVAVLYGISVVWIVRGIVRYPQADFPYWLLFFFSVGAALSLVYARQLRHS